VLEAQNIESFEDNGFSCLDAMNRAHRVLIDAVEILGVRVGRVLDLGAGDGTLLAKINIMWPRLQVHGVEASKEKCIRGLVLHPNVDFRAERIEECTEDEILPEDEKWDIVIFMPGRLDEVRPEDAAKIVRVLRKQARHLIIYSYSGKLAEMAKKHGLLVRGSLLRSSSDATQAAIAW
jgi:hypothetical protein